jgi:hypothetical protein
MNKSQLATKFAEMCNLGLDKFPNTLTLTLVRKAVAVASAVSPGWFIEYVGPFFYDKRKEIMDDNFEFFITRSWSEQYASWGFMGQALAAQWEVTIKESLQHVHRAEPDSLRGIARSLVAMYCRYLIICQQENDNKTE